MSDCTRCISARCQAAAYDGDPTTVMCEAHEASAARDRIATLERELAEVTRERDALRAGKWAGPATEHNVHGCMMDGCHCPRFEGADATTTDIDACARAAHASYRHDADSTWTEATELCRDRWRAIARAVLAAARGAGR